MAWRSNIASCLNLQSSCKREGFCHNMSSLSCFVYLSHTMESLDTASEKNSENWSCTSFSKLRTWSFSSKMFAFLWQEFPWSWKLFCCRPRWDIFHPTDSYFRRSTLALMVASWWHRWWVVTPNIGVINEMPPLGEAVDQFLREVLSLWINKTWRQNRVECQTGFYILFCYSALTLIWND